MDEYISRNDALLHSEIIRVYSKDYGNIDVVPVEYLADIPSADVQPINQWINCQDKMPEEYKTALVYEKDYGVMWGDYQGIKYSQPVWIARKSGLIIRTTEVTHWQPLPEPPKDGDTNG